MIVNFNVHSVLKKNWIVSNVKSCLIVIMNISDENIKAKGLNELRIQIISLVALAIAQYSVSAENLDIVSYFFSFS